MFKPLIGECCEIKINKNEFRTSHIISMVLSLNFMFFEPNKISSGLKSESILGVKNLTKVRQSCA